MRVGLIYVHALRKGGYPRDIRWLASALANHEADVVLFTRAGDICEGLCDKVRVEDVKAVGEVDVDLFEVFGLLIPGHAVVLWKLRSMRQPVVISPMAHLMPYALKVRKIPKLLYLEMLSILINPAIFHVFSPLERESVRKHFGDRKAFIATLGVYPERYTTSGERQNDKKGRLEILFFGRNDVYQKGIDILLEGFLKASKRGARLNLMIAGQPWKNSSRHIHRFINQHRLHENVRVIGKVDEKTKWRLIAGADYLVFLSRCDGPPRPVREAISVGTPVIVSPETNMGYLVEEYKAGVQVHLDPNAVADTLLKLSSQPELRSSFAERVLELRERLRWERVAADYIEEYTAILRET